MSLATNHPRTVNTNARTITPASATPTTSAAINTAIPMHSAAKATTMDLKRDTRRGASGTTDPSFVDPLPTMISRRILLFYGCGDKSPPLFERRQVAALQSLL